MTVSRAVVLQEQLGPLWAKMRAAFTPWSPTSQHTAWMGGYVEGLRDADRMFERKHDSCLLGDVHRADDV